MRLFDDQKKIALEIGTIVNNGIPVDIESFKEAEDTIEIIGESFKPIVQDYESVKDIKEAMESPKYLYAVEAYGSFIERISSNMGVGVGFPSLEDYTNDYTAKQARDISLEGLRSFLKKVWERIRDFFIKFFRKFAEFGRRLTNANLQIDTYEKYVPELLKKIKINKLTPSDPKHEVQSNLSKLLAPTGIDKLDSVWVVNNTKPIINSILRVNAELYGKRLPSIGLNQLGTIKEVLKNGFNDIERYASVNDIENKIEEQVDKIKSSILDSVKSLCPEVIEPKDLDEKAYDQLSDMYNSGSLSDLSIFALSDNKNNFTRLPKSFNLVIGASPDDKIYAVSFNEDTSSKSSSIEILSDIVALETVYEQYKTLTKDFNWKKTLSIFSKVEDDLNDFLKSIPKSMEKLTEKFNPKEGSGDLSKISGQLISDMASTYGDVYALTETIPNFDHSKLLVKYDIEMNNDSYHKKHPDVFLNIVRSLNNLVNYEPLRESKREEIRELLDQFQLEVYGTSIPKETLGHIASRIDSIDTMLVNFVQNLQVALRGIQSTYPGLITELRYELIKYVYDSARKFD